MKIRNQKLTTPTLIRILRRLVHRRAFQQRKAKPGTSHVEGPAAAAVASLERPSILISNKWGPPDFKSRQVTSMTTLANTVFLCAAVFLTSDAVIAQTPQKSSAQSSPQFQVGVHLSRAKPDSGEPDMGAIARETADTIAGNIEQPVMTPTRSSFLAKWQPVSGATGYRLDVSTSSSFDSCVSTYRDLDVGNVSSHLVAGLNRGTKYYYRVRPYNSAGTGDNSESTSEATANVGSGLVIVPTFDSTITSDPRSSAIQAMIISAIQKYQTLFSDPITVSIRFRYSGFHLEGDPMGTLVGASNSGIHQIDWNTYIAALQADGKTANDMSANATLPTSALSTIILTNSADGRAIGLNTPPVMFADGSLGVGGPYDGIITINSLKPVQFTRPVAEGNFDGQMFTEHEIDEVLGMGSHLGSVAPQHLAPEDLFSWASLNARNTTASGQRFFSIDRGLHYIVQFNQNPDGDFGDYDSDGFCPATRLYVQNAFNCDGQSTDISATSPEGISLDVIGYDLGVASGTTSPFDFNRDGKPDFILLNSSTRQTVIGYMNNNVYFSAAFGPTLPAGWNLINIADFNQDGKPDYLLFNPTSLQSAIWYMDNNVLVSGAYGPTLPAGWTLVGAADFNGDGKPDYVIFNATTLQTVVWYMNNNVYLSSDWGPTLPAGWRFIGAADFNRDGKNDYLLFNPSTRQSAIWYLLGVVRTSGAYGPTITSGYRLIGTADFNSDGKTDFVLFNPSTRQTALWYLSNNSLISGAYGPLVTSGWALTAP